MRHTLDVPKVVFVCRLVVCGERVNAKPTLICLFSRWNLHYSVLKHSSQKLQFSIIGLLYLIYYIVFLPFPGYELISPQPPLAIENKTITTFYSSGKKGLLLTPFAPPLLLFDLHNLWIQNFWHISRIRSHIYSSQVFRKTFAILLSQGDICYFIISYEARLKLCFNFESFKSTFKHGTTF